MNRSVIVNSSVIARRLNFSPVPTKQSFQSLILAVTIILLSTVPASAIDAFKYDASGRRDPFIPLVGNEKPANTGLEDISSLEDVKLEGIALGPKGRNRAIINGEMVKEGDKFGILEIKKITKKEVNILLGGAEHKLSLSEEGGELGRK